jgi:gliding motility-associated-like protein
VTRLGLRLFLFLYLVSGLLSKASATHIVGGEMYYDCLGGNNYRFTLKLYRDCLAGQAPYDNPATFTLWSANGTMVQNFLVPFPGSVGVPFIPGNPCFQSPPNVCVEEAVYTLDVNLPGGPSSLIMAYQRCCRNNSIVNLVNPQSTGSTYRTQIPPATQVTCNSSPRFKNFPPIAICIGDTLNFDHSATDPDGDSLVYELCATYSGATPNNPMPSPTSPPPFTPIVFLSPYSPNYPIATNPPVTINPQTGLLRVAPTQIGQFVVGVCVREYRNGQLLGVHQRDFQFNITPCATNVNANLDLSSNFIPIPPNLYEACGQYMVNFINNSQNASLYFWDFGVPGINSDTSSAFEPTYVYPGPGTYTITLIANPGYFCADTATAILTLQDPPGLQLLPPDPQCIDENSFTFQLQGAISPGLSINWNFGNQASPPNGNTSVVSNVAYSQPGNYPYVVVYEEGICRDSIFGIAVLYGSPQVEPPPPAVGCDPYTHTFSPQIDPQNNTLAYQWNLGNGLSSTLPNPTTTYGPGIYSPFFTVISLTGCRDTLNFFLQDHILVHPSPQAGFLTDEFEQSIFDATFQFTSTANNAVNCILYTGDGFFSDNCNLSYTYSEPGNYDVVQIVFNEFGCPDTAVIPIRVLPEFTFFIPNAFTPTDDGVNDGFRGYGLGIHRYRFRIFDRWGGQLFESDNLFEPWNGKVQNTGLAVPAGLYVYAVDLIDVFNRPHSYRGKVLLIRKSGIGP